MADIDAEREQHQVVALVGIGKMGLAIGERLLGAGYPLAVYNRTPAKAQPLLEGGATALGTPADALRQAHVCVTMVADDAALHAVALGQAGVLAGGRAGTTLIDMSTVSVDASEAVAERAVELGVDYLRAPVSGNPGVVRAGSATLIVSGPAKAAHEFDALLRAIGPNVYYVGAGEDARVVKLALQVMIAGTAELMSEALVLAESAGVDRASLLEVMGGSAVGSPFVRYKTEPLLNDDYTATFTTEMMLKDVRLVLGLAARTQVPLPLTGVLLELLTEATKAGHGDIDFMALYLHLRARGARRRHRP